MSQPVITARDLRVWYGTDAGPVRAVDGVSFTLHPGETLGLVGESGCGKSTLGRGLLGLLPAGAKVDGEVRYRRAADAPGRDQPATDGPDPRSEDGRGPRSEEARGRRDALRVAGDRDIDLVAARPRDLQRLRGPDLGLIFQEPLTRLNPLLRISDHFEEAVHTHEPDLPAAQVTHRAIQALRGMGIPPTRYRAYPHEFSGGMRQRIMIALALVLQPAFVVADEPTTALDVLVEAQIIQILTDLRRNFDTALLFITHNLGIIAEACDRVAVMYAGRIVEQGPVADVFARPRHPYTRELLRSTISLSTTGLHYIPGAPPDLVDPPSGCRFHPRCPEAMRVCAEQFPQRTTIATEHDEQQVECWLNGPADRIGPDGREPLVREEITVADEA